MCKPIKRISPPPPPEGEFISAPLVALKYFVEYLPCCGKHYTTVDVDGSFCMHCLPIEVLSCVMTLDSFGDHFKFPIFFGSCLINTFIQFFKGINNSNISIA